MAVNLKGPLIKSSLLHVQCLKPLNQCRGVKSPFRGKKQKNIEKIFYQDLNMPDPNNPDFEEGEFHPRKLTYMPPDLNINKPYYQIPGNRKPPRNFITLYPQIDNREEWTEKPEYPPLFDDTKDDAMFARQRMSWYAKIRSLPTVDMKFFEIVDKMQHKCILLDCWSHNFNYLSMFQDVTRTHLIKNQLPSEYEAMDVKTSMDAIRGPLLDAVRCHLYEHEKDLLVEFRPKCPKKEARYDAATIEGLIQDINSVCQNVLSCEHPHIMNLQVDYTPDVRSWWWKTMLRPRNSTYHKFKKKPYCDQPIQYNSQAALQLRSKDPLPTPIPLDVPLVMTAEVPDFPCNPAKAGFPSVWKYMQTIPGFWNLIEHDKFDFPFLSFVSRHHLKQRESISGYNYPDTADFIDGIGVMHNFGWLNGIAGIHGFTPYDELTYPLTSQLIVTDGQYWSFFVYQLNTHSFHSDVDLNDRRNLCWSTGELKLFESYSDGQFTGVNDKVLEYLAKLFTRCPVPVNDTVQLRPYLGEDTRTEEEIEKTRNYLRREYTQGLNHRLRGRTQTWRVAPFEWVYMRNPKAPSSLLWRMPYRYPKPDKRGLFTL